MTFHGLQVLIMFFYPSPILVLLIPFIIDLNQLNSILIFKIGIYDSKPGLRAFALEGSAGEFLGFI